MNILIVTGSMDNGGAETHVLELARALQRRKNNVTVASVGGKLFNVLENERIDCIRLPLNSKAPISILICAKRLTELIRARNIDVVHAHTRMSAFSADIACNRCGVPLVTTAHAFYKENILLDRFSRWGNGTVAVSQDIGQHILEHGKNVLAENVLVIPNGVDTDWFKPSDTYTALPEIVFSSRLDADCSEVAYALLSLAPLLNAEIPDIQIALCGAGSEYKELLKMAGKVNGAVGRELVKMNGYVSNMPSVLCNATVFVGVSRSALEAMSCSVPVILAGNEGYIGELVGDRLLLAENTNFCCRGKHKMSLDKLFADLKRALLKSAEQRKSDGERLRGYVVENHSIAAVAEQTESFYKRYVNRKSYVGKLLLCGYYGFGNMGDDALLLQSLKRARKKYPRLLPCAMTAGGKRDSGRFGGIRCIKRTNPIALAREIRRSEAVIFGGGTLLQSSTSYRSLGYYLCILRYAQAHGKRTELWGNGIDEIGGKYWRHAVARVLEKCDYVGLRDVQSLRYAERLVRTETFKNITAVLENDLALAPFYSERGRFEYILSSFNISVKEKNTVVAVRGSDTNENIGVLKRWLYALKGDGEKLLFIVMYPKEDLKLSQRICDELGGTLVYPIGISDTAELIRASSLVCSMRYHALVFAAAAGTHFIGFGGERKVRDFCRLDGGLYWCDREL